MLSVIDTFMRVLAPRCRRTLARVLMDGVARRSARERRDLECKFHLQDMASFVSDLDSHPLVFASFVPGRVHRISGHFRQGSRGLLPGACDVRQLESLFVNG
jgi:hypothetical protein